MKLVELARFLQEMAQDNFDRHTKEDPDDACEISYHQGQLSVLEVLIPRIPPDVEALEEASDER